MHSRVRPRRERSGEIRRASAPSKFP
jgi:hypothetical protein